jgi:hypothetical protein
MQNLFAGSWKLEPAESLFDPNHRPAEAIMHWEHHQDGFYLMTAEGVNAKGEKCAERPQKMIPDGRPYAVPDLTGLTAVVTQPDPLTVYARVTREDGSVVGEAQYAVSPDGRRMTATTSGFDTQFRRFEMQTVWRKHAPADRLQIAP